jgi:hypothetical protein
MPADRPADGAPRLTPEERAYAQAVAEAGAVLPAANLFRLLSALRAVERERDAMQRRAESAEVDWQAAQRERDQARRDAIAEVQAAIPATFWGAGSRWPDGTDPYAEGGNAALTCVRSILARLEDMPDADRMARALSPGAATPHQEERP